MSTDGDALILLTGATGYVGGRLRRLLESRGCRLRCLARRPDYLIRRVAPGTDVVQGDVLDAASLAEAMRGVRIAYYLVHAMGDSGDFEAKERAGALNFAAAARAAGLSRIVYLGGLGDATRPLSSHLRSRQEVGRVLRESGVPTLELRASIVIGSGSLSFELVRALTERLPVMVTPRWVDVRAQPIAVDDLLAYLLQAMSVPLDASRIVEIGGADRVSYGELMREYARQRGLTRYMIRVPVLTPRLSSLWLRLVTPLYASVGRKLIESIRHPTVVTDDSASELFTVRPMGIADAIAAALRNEDREIAETRWQDARSSAEPERTWAGVRFGNRFVDTRTRHVSLPPAQVFAPIRRIGGRTGWYAYNWLWGVRGLLDLLVGGVGLRRGRVHADRIAVGDTLDFWRVEEYEPDRRLRLAAEMKLPGRAWLEFEVTPEPGGSVIRQTAVFDPVGLSGLLYWYSVFPAHRFVFEGMLRGICDAAQEQHEADDARADDG